MLDPRWLFFLLLFVPVVAISASRSWLPPSIYDDLVNVMSWLILGTVLAGVVLQLRQRWRRDRDDDQDRGRHNSKGPTTLT
jgi:putative effector of murein hydrolase LrgA (UPF0299 family)